MGVAIMAGREDRAQAAPETRAYRLLAKLEDEDYEVMAADIVRVVGVELCTIDWAIRHDGAFENGRWRVEWARRGTCYEV